MSPDSERFTEAEWQWCRDFGRRVRDIRLSRGMTQKQLAKAAGLRSDYLSEVERGVQNIALINIYRLLNALNVWPDDLL